MSSTLLWYRDLQLTVLATHIDAVNVHDQSITGEMIAVTNSKLICSINFFASHRRPALGNILWKLSSVDITATVS